jgi:hypothetical protein
MTNEEESRDGEHRMLIRVFRNRHYRPISAKAFNALVDEEVPGR